MPMPNLRHGAATLARATGADLKGVQELLGHTSIVLTADTYTSVLTQLQFQGRRSRRPTRPRHRCPQTRSAAPSTTPNRSKKVLGDHALHRPGTRTSQAIPPQEAPQEVTHPHDTQRSRP